MVADGEHLNQSSYAFARSTATALRRRLGSSLVVPAQADRSPRSCIKAARAPRAFTRRFTPAFTIVELLVVISIVTILASFLMPAFARVREAAERLQCSNNMRQIGCAIMSYADDNNDGVQHSIASPTGFGSCASGNYQLFWLQDNIFDEPNLLFVPFLSVYDDRAARDAKASNWSNITSLVSELTGPSGYISQFGDKITFNRFSGLPERKVR